MLKCLCTLPAIVLSLTRTPGPRFTRRSLPAIPVPTEDPQPLS